jgi:hypothetical protein
MELNNLQKIKIKELRDEIFNRLGLNAPWIMLPLQQKTIRELKKYTYKVIAKYTREIKEYKKALRD